MIEIKESKYAILIKSDSADSDSVRDFVKTIEMFSKRYENLTISKIVTPDTKREIDPMNFLWNDEIYGHYGIVLGK